MKRIINGKRYDTEKSILVGEASADCPRNDFSFWEAGLYKTPRSGEFFLAGEGGPMTRFARRVESGRIGGELIEPMTMEEARDWAERYLLTAAIEAHFPVEDA